MITVYSIEWRFGGRTFRKFFETEREAVQWRESVLESLTGKDAFVGPLKHEVNGASGLVSFLETYIR